MTDYRMLFKVTMVNGDTYELKYPVSKYIYEENYFQDAIEDILRQKMIFTAANFVIVPRFIVDVAYIGKV